MLDAFTIRERTGKIAGLNVTILGDILFSRVARSNIWALIKLGASHALRSVHARPRTFEAMGCRVTHDVDEALREADIIHLLRIQHERQRKTMFPSIGEYTTLVRPEQGALCQRPGPTRSSCIPARSTAAWEIDNELADCGRSLILEPVTNGLAVRMAVMFLINGGKGRRKSRRVKFFPRTARISWRAPGTFPYSPDMKSMTATGAGNALATDSMSPSNSVP